jgi:Flp pilus assembly protein CpaB
MRGSPLLRALLAFFVIGLLGWPLARLTRRSEARMAGAPPAEAEEKPVLVAIRFTQLPRSVSISHLGQEKWKTTEVKEPEIETELKLPWPPEGVDLRIAIDWPDGSVFAGAQVRVTDPEGTEHFGSIFSKGSADEVLTFR